jgi:microcystin degradation protein MlrC
LILIEEGLEDARERHNCGQNRRRDLRIAVAGIAHETNTFSTLRTVLSDFTLLRGEEIVRGAFWDSYRSEGVDLVGLMTASAAPNGPVQREAYLSLKREILERLERALPVDGVYLSLHGAMEVEGIGDDETDLLRAIQERVGNDTPIAASLDLHANLAPAGVAGKGRVLQAH